MSSAPVSPAAAALILTGLGIVVFAALHWSGRRLAFDLGGDLVLEETTWWGYGHRTIGRIDGTGGRWWLVRKDGTPSEWSWEEQEDLLIGRGGR